MTSLTQGQYNTIRAIPMFNHLPDVRTLRDLFKSIQFEPGIQTSQLIFHSHLTKQREKGAADCKFHSLIYDVVTSRLTTHD